MAGDEHHRDVAVHRHHAGEAGQPVHARQAHVGHHHAAVAGGDALQGRLGALEGAHRDVGQGERLLQPQAHRGIVFDQQY